VFTASLLDRLEQHVTRVRAITGRAAVVVLGLCLSIVAVVSLLYAQATPFEHDEIYTVELARLASVSDIWAAGRRGVDLMPPLNTLLTHAVGSIVPLTEISARVPPLLAFLVLAVVSFELVRRRSNALAGFSSVFILFFSAAFPFSYVARGYELTLASMTVALFAWAESARGRRRAMHLPLLAVSLAAAVWAHYFAVLIAAPVVAGEVVRTLRSRRVDLGVAGALLGAALLIAPLLPLVTVAAAESESFWSRARWGDVGPTYRLLAHSLVGPRFIWLWVPVAAACGVGLAVGRRRRSDRTLPAHEVAAGAVLALTPVLAIAVGVLVTHAFVPRYAIAGTLALAVDLPLLVWWTGSRIGEAELALCLVLFGGFLQGVYETATHPPVRAEALTKRTVLMDLLDRSSSVAVTGVAYLDCWYYAPPEIRARLTYVADPAASRRLVGSDTIDRNYLALRTLIPIQVEDYGTYTATHHAFGVYAEGLFAWLPAKLAEDGASITPVDRRTGVASYDVMLPPRR
jgi:hypothetical protein